MNNTPKIDKFPKSIDTGFIRCYYPQVMSQSNEGDPGRKVPETRLIDWLVHRVTSNFSGSQTLRTDDGSHVPLTLELASAMALDETGIHESELFSLIVGQTTVEAVVFPQQQPVSLNHLTFKINVQIVASEVAARYPVLVAEDMERRGLGPTDTTRPN